MDVTIFGQDQDIFYMQEAYKEAELAFEHNEVPVGAVVVDEFGTIIARGYNQVELRYSQVAHAEIEAINRACQLKKNWRLTGCWLYVTLEPCMMCMGFIKLARIAGVFYGARSPLFGYKLDNKAVSSVYQDGVLIVGDLCQQKIGDLMRRFFKKHRVRGG